MLQQDTDIVLVPHQCMTGITVHLFNKLTRLQDEHLATTPTT